jgi:hypothetical protein
MKKNKSLHTHNIYINSEVQDPEWWKTSLEVGTDESEDMQDQQLKGRLKKKYRPTRRLRMILKTEQNAKTNFSNWSSSNRSNKKEFLCN